MRIYTEFYLLGLNPKGKKVNMVRFSKIDPKSKHPFMNVEKTWTIPVSRSHIIRNILNKYDYVNIAEYLLEEY